MILINISGFAPPELVVELDKYKVKREKPKVIFYFGNILQHNYLSALCQSGGLLDRYKNDFTFVDILQQPEFHITHITEQEAVFLPHSGRRFVGFFSSIDEKWDERKMLNEVNGNKRRVSPPDWKPGQSCVYD